MTNNKTAIVIGGTGGIGSSVVSQLIKKNYRVVTASNDIQNYHIISSLETALFVDVTHETSVLELFKKTDQLFKKIDVLVNCSGLGIFKPIDEFSLQEWNSVIQINLTGAFLCAKEAFKRMKISGGGRIIHMGSVSDHIPLVSNAAYGSSKYALRGLTKILTEEGKSFNIRASLITLGAVNTKIWSDRTEFDIKDMLQPEDVANVISNIADAPLNIRYDEIKLFPPKGVL